MLTESSLGDGATWCGQALDNDERILFCNSIPERLFLRKQILPVRRQSKILSVNKKAGKKDAPVEEWSCQKQNPTGRPSKNVDYFKMPNELWETVEKYLPVKLLQRGLSRARANDQAA